MGLNVSAPFNDHGFQAANKQRNLEQSFYPPVDSSGEDLECKMQKLVRCWNTDLCDHVLSYVSDILTQACQYMNAESGGIQVVDLFEYMLPTVVASLSLFPVHVPYISTTMAFNVLPLLVKCSALLGDRLKGLSCNVPNAPIRMGAWTFRLTTKNSGGSALESITGFQHHEFQMSINPCSADESSDVITFEGSGKSSSSVNPRDSVYIAGVAIGTLVRLVQVLEKKPGEGNESTAVYLVEGRLNLDGTMFEGFYNDKVGHVQGKMAAICTLGKMNADADSNKGNILYCRLMSRLFHLVSSATQHMCLILNSCDALTQSHPQSRSPLLSGGCNRMNSTSVLFEMHHFNSIGTAIISKAKSQEVTDFQEQCAM